MTDIGKLKPFGDAGFLNVITETPKGSRNKYSFDMELGMFRLKRVLPVGAVFPFDFGFVPGTVGEDGDPLDVLLLMDEPAFPGCLVEAKLLCVIKASQTKQGVTQRNDRFVATARKMKGICQPATIKGLSADIRDQIVHFFVSYNAIEGKNFKATGFAGPDAAKRLIEIGSRKPLHPINRAARAAAQSTLSRNLFQNGLL